MHNSIDIKNTVTTSKRYVKLPALKQDNNTVTSTTAILITYIEGKNDTGKVGGAGKSLNGLKKFGRRKVKNKRKSPWGHGFNRPVPNGLSNSGF